jgi:hypothetical protein
MLDPPPHATRARADSSVPVVEVSSVSAPEEAPAAILGARIGQPGAGEARDAFALDVAGWVIGRDARAVSVEVVSDGEVVRTLPVAFPRPAVAAAFPGVDESLPCGFRGLVGALGLPLDFELELRAVLEDGSRAAIGSVKGRRARPTLSSTPTLRPVLVTSLGRSGSTWLVRTLEAHPEIVVQPGFNYERTPARYWAHMLERLSEPADAAAGGASAEELARVGPNPAYRTYVAADEELGRWLGRTYVDRLADFCMRSTDDWYTLLARKQGKPGARHFVEKNFVWPTPNRLPVADIYPGVHEIFLVRDPRDVACSWVAFHGARLGAEQILRSTLPRLTDQLLLAWRRRGAEALLVRYEDLVLDRTRTLARVLDHLGAESAEPVVGRLAAVGADEVFDRHGTSSDPEASIGRWRGEGDEAFRRELHDLFREALVEFGYPEPDYRGGGAAQTP